MSNIVSKMRVFILTKHLLINVLAKDIVNI